MGKTTGIEWTESTWNPVTGCSKVSQGCKYCYAERDWGRLQHLPAYHGRAFTDVATHSNRLDQPLRWQKPRRIFVNSMSDLFHPDVPDLFIWRVFIVMAQATRHTFQVLTKRPDRAFGIISKWCDTGLVFRSGYGAVLPNVWLGVSVEDQAAADERIPILLKTPAAVRWVSAEPLLGPVAIGAYLSRTNMPGLRLMPGFIDPLPGLQWVVCGGESGPHARPMHAAWARALRDQCAVAGVPFLFKQWGEWIDADQDECPVGSPRDRWMWADGSPFFSQDGQRAMPLFCRTGKKRAGRLLDGVQHDGYPSMLDGDLLANGA